MLTWHIWLKEKLVAFTVTYFHVCRLQPKEHSSRSYKAALKRNKILCLVSQRVQQAGKDPRKLKDYDTAE